MITNDAELEVVRRQYGLAMDVVASYHRQLFHANRKNYWLYSEAFRDTLLALRKDIDEYLGIGAAPAEESLQPCPSSAPAIGTTPETVTPQAAAR